MQKCVLSGALELSVLSLNAFNSERSKILLFSIEFNFSSPNTVMLNL